MSKIKLLKLCYHLGNFITSNANACLDVKCGKFYNKLSCFDQFNFEKEIK